jgi:hypothetical protein
MRILLFCAVGLALGACETTPELSASDPSSAASGTTIASYEPVLAGFQSRRPVEPDGWVRQNDQVAPGGSVQ